MTENLFLDWAIKLLEQIETADEKKLWCRRYSVYSRSPGQETLARDLHDFVDRTYQAGPRAFTLSFIFAIPIPDFSGS